MSPDHLGGVRGLETVGVVAYTRTHVRYILDRRPGRGERVRGDRGEPERAARAGAARAGARRAVGEDPRPGHPAHAVRRAGPAGHGACQAARRARYPTGDRVRVCRAGHADGHRVHRRRQPDPRRAGPATPAPVHVAGPPRRRGPGLEGPQGRAPRARRRAQPRTGATRGRADHTVRGLPELERVRGPGRGQDHRGRPRRRRSPPAGPRRWNSSSAPASPTSSA